MERYNHLIYARIDKYLNIILIVGSVIAFVGSFFYIAGNLIIYSLLNFIAGIILLVFFVMAKKIKTSNKLAYYDQLTKLPNAYKFKQEIEEIIVEHQKNGI